MAERFVVGFSVDFNELEALVGSGRSAGALIEAAGGAEEIDDLLKEWSDDPLTAEQALGQLTAGELDPKRAYEYRRVLELTAGALGERFDDEIEVVLTYYLPNDSHGRWNPVLEALGLTGLARVWGTSNTAYPWSEGESRIDWPVATWIRPGDAGELAAELETLAGGALDALGDELLTEEGAEEAADVREELAAGLATLAVWLGEVHADGRTLLLLMDGSQ